MKVNERAVQSGDIRWIHKDVYVTKRIGNEDVKFNPQDKLRFVNSNSNGSQKERHSVFGYYPPYDWKYSRKDIRQMKKDFRMYSEFEDGTLTYKCPYCGNWVCNPDSGWYYYEQTYMDGDVEVRPNMNVPCHDNCQLMFFMQSLPIKHYSLFQRIMAFFFFHGIRCYSGWKNRIIPLVKLNMFLYNTLAKSYNRKSRRLRESASKWENPII